MNSVLNLMRNLSPIIRSSLFVLSVVAFILSGACSTLSGSPASISVTVEDNGQVYQAAIPSGTTVQSVLERLGISLSALDRTEPPTYTILTSTSRISIIRVKEVFETEEIAIPFEQQIVKNESLPEGESRLVQPGENGLQQITYRRLLENGREVSRTVFKTEIIAEPRPEIVMVGVQSPFTPVDLPGTLAYLAGGNAWIMRQNTGNRYPVVTSGDLDGRIFTLSPDGEWLLYTRQSSQAGIINSLWVVNIQAESPKPINLKVNNIIHHAEWVPGTPRTITYSTVEPRSAPPGWQANNDLHRLTFAADGRVLKDEVLIDTNAGGIYGWWGASFAWSPDGTRLAYARPDSVGLINLKDKTFESFLDLAPYETGGDWAWVPTVAWSADNQILFTVSHPSSENNGSESSPWFHLSALVLNPALTIDLVKNAGMFANPTSSPYPNNLGQNVAFLQAIFPDQSANSRYRLLIMDRDGSNRRTLFPPEGSVGLEPQSPVWSPRGDNDSNQWLAVIYQGNLWLVDVISGETRQVTGDGLIRRIDWK